MQPDLRWEGSFHESIERLRQVRHFWSKQQLHMKSYYEGISDSF
jgi:hypothetical protein